MSGFLQRFGVLARAQVARVSGQTSGSRRTVLPVPLGRKEMLSLSCDGTRANRWVMATKAAHPDKAAQAARTRTCPANRTAFVAWAAVWTLVTAIPFVAVTALTIGLWATSAGYTDTNPVLDAGFFTVGAIIAVGFASQLRRPPRIAGVQQAALGTLTLGAVGLIGERIEPLVGALVLLGAVAMLAGLHPDRDDLLAGGCAVSLPLAGLATLAALVGAAHAWRMLGMATDAGPSCSLGQCARGDRFAETAAATVAGVLIGFLASAQTRGWRIPHWSAGAGSVVIGLASVALQDDVGSLGLQGGLFAVLWGIVFVACGELRGRVPGTVSITP